jgi:hypothetical protein
MNRREMLRGILVVMAAAPLAACQPAKINAGADYLKKVKLAPVGDLPEDVRKLAINVQQGYQFAIANPDVLKQVPCYCGCGSMGHDSNYSCYIKSDAGGKIVFDQHATGCSICVDITHDTMRGLAAGKTVAEIKAEVDQTYSQYGPSNMND